MKKTLLSALQSWFKTRDQCLLLPVGPDNLLLSICPSGTTFVKSNQLHLQTDSRKTVSRNNPSVELSTTVFTSQTGQGRNHPSAKSTKTTLGKPGRERKDSETSTNKNKNNQLMLMLPEWVDWLRDLLRYLAGYIKLPLCSLSWKSHWNLQLRETKAVDKTANHLLWKTYPLDKSHSHFSYLTTEFQH